MKRSLLALILTLVPTAAFAQIPGFTGNYTADLTCAPQPNSVVDAVLAAQANYLERGTTVTPAGTHPVCSLALKYDQIVFNGVPTGAGPLEVAHIILDLKPKAGFTCPNALGAPLMDPSKKVSFIPLMHQNDATFVTQSRFGFGYNAYLGVINRAHTVGSTQWTAAPATPSIPADNVLNFQAVFHTRVPVTNTANLSYLSAALDAPVFGTTAFNQQLGIFAPAWNVVTWNAGTNTTAQNAVLNWSSSVVNPVVNSNYPSLNQTPLGSVHFEGTPFSATLPVNCL
jgi:hypothetical protein